jgi:hypothetical protein
LFDIFLTDESDEQLKRLKIDKGLLKCYKAIKKGLHLCKPLISLVAGRGFEPLAFGL